MRRIFLLLFLLFVSLSSYAIEINNPFSGSVEMMRQEDTWHVYGGFQDNTTQNAIDADTWTTITGNLFNIAESNDITLDNGIITIKNSGDYVGVLSITFEGAYTKDYLFRVLNCTTGSPIGYHIGATGLGNNNYANVCIPLYLEVNAGECFSFQVYQAEGNDVLFLNSIFEIKYLHD